MVLRGRVCVITYNDDGTVIENIVLNLSEGRYGVNVGKNVWHTVEALESGSVIFECKQGPYVPHEEEGILEVPKRRGKSGVLFGNSAASYSGYSGDKGITLTSDF